MVQRVTTVAFEGIEARAVDVQVQVVPGLPAFIILCYIKSEPSTMVSHAPVIQSSRVFIPADVHGLAAERG
jgi:hypothetical protein